MGLREKDKITLTICCGMVDKYVKNPEEYKAACAVLKEEAEKLAPKYTNRDVEVFINTGDNLDSDDEAGYFLTVTGTSAEMGDDGSVGRGNRANGLITPCRPMSMEATSGKNPVNHVGKIYNILASRIAAEIAEKIPEVKQVHIMLLSQIGRPIDNPKAASTQVILEDGCKLEDVKADIEKIIDEGLENITDIAQDVIAGNARTF